MRSFLRTLAAATLVLGVTGGPLLAQRTAGPPVIDIPANFRGVANIIVADGPVNGYRTHQARPNLVFRTGETIHFYAEPIGFGLQDQGNQRVLNMSASVEFIDGNDRVAYRTDNPIPINGNFERGQDRLYVTVWQVVPQLAAGEYRLRITFRDNFTGRTIQNARVMTVAPGSRQTPPVAQVPPQQRQAPPQVRQPQPPVAQPPSRQQARIAVENLQFTEGLANGFRQFLRRTSNEFASGEQFNLYFEMRNFGTRFDGSAIRGAFSIDVAVFNTAGQVVVRQDGFWKLPLEVAATEDGPVQGVYGAVSSNLTTNPGNYRMVLRINDEIGGTSSEIAIDIVIRGQAVPPQAQAPQTPPNPAEEPGSPDGAPRQIRFPVEDFIRRR